LDTREKDRQQMGEGVRIGFERHAEHPEPDDLERQRHEAG
jgi:hypothetical protein